MTFIAYTNCETGFRHFTDLNGVDLSFDKKFIEHIIKERSSQTNLMKEHHEQQERDLATAKEQAGNIPPIMDCIMAQNRKTIVDQLLWVKRLSTAEAALNGELVRDVMFFEKIEHAVEYTTGVVRDIPKPQ